MDLSLASARQVRNTQQTSDKGLMEVRTWRALKRENSGSAGGPAAQPRKYRTLGRRSGLGRPSTVAAQPMTSGRRPNSAKTCPSRSGPG